MPKWITEFFQKLFGRTPKSSSIGIDSGAPVVVPLDEDITTELDVKDVDTSPVADPDAVDDPAYDVENETPDDDTPRDTLPEPEPDVVQDIELRMAVLPVWEERQQWLTDLGFDPGPVDGKPGRKTNAAVVAFQKSAGLKADGDWGPQTESAIKKALVAKGKPAPITPIPPPPLSPTPPYVDMLGKVEVDAEFFASLVDLTSKSNVKNEKGLLPRKGTRKHTALTRICWHQTAFTWKPYKELVAAKKYSSHHKINAHVCFDTDGSILLIHNFFYYLWTANAFNQSCLSWEIMGNFEGVLGTGNWYKGDTFGRSRPQRIQIVRCRQMTLWMMDPEQGPPDAELSMPLREWRIAVRNYGNPIKWVNAHRQATDDRVIDCGSECWYHIARWSVETIKGLTVGPEKGKGLKIPVAWNMPPTSPPQI